MIQKYKVTNTDPEPRRVNGIDFESDEHKEVCWTDGEVLNAERHETIDEKEEDGKRPTFIIKYLGPAPEPEEESEEEAPAPEPEPEPSPVPEEGNAPAPAPEPKKSKESN